MTKTSLKRLLDEFLVQHRVPSAHVEGEGLMLARQQGAVRVITCNFIFSTERLTAMQTLTNTTAQQNVTTHDHNAQWCSHTSCRSAPDWHRIYPSALVTAHVQLRLKAFCVSVCKTVWCPVFSADALPPLHPSNVRQNQTHTSFHISVANVSLSSTDVSGSGFCRDVFSQSQFLLNTKRRFNKTSGDVL